MQDSSEVVDLVGIVEESLRRRGVISQLKARIRAEVYNALEDKTVDLPEKPKEVFLVSELIKEFLECMQLSNSLSVFKEEIGGESESEDFIAKRSFIAGELGFNAVSTDRDVPLLLLVVKHLIQQKSGLDSLSHETS